MRTGRAVRWFVIVAILAIGGCSKSSTPQNSASNAGNTAGGNAPAAGAPAVKTAPSQPAPPPSVVIDAGTLLTVTLDQSVSSKTNNREDTFAASLAAPISVGGVVALPPGTRARGTVLQADSAGRVKAARFLR